MRNDFNKTKTALTKIIFVAPVNGVRKKKINWKLREKKLIKLLNKHRLRSRNNNFNCLVPCSGGKDGSMWPIS